MRTFGCLARVVFGLAGRRSSLILLLIALLMFQSSAPAQTAVMQRGDWSAVLSRTPGETLIVKLKNGKKVQGALHGAADDSLVLTRENKDLDLKRDQIVSVAVAGKQKSVVKPVLIGLGVGAGVGAGIGAAVNGNESGPSFVLSKGQERAIGAAVGGAIGALGGSVIGYFAGRGKRSQTLIYEAPK